MLRGVGCSNLLAAIGIPPRPAKHGESNPCESDHHTSQRRVEIPDAMQIVELVKIPAFQSGNNNFRNPSPKENECDPDRNQPASKQEEVNLFFHRLLLSMLSLRVMTLALDGSRLNLITCSMSLSGSRFDVTTA